MNRRQTLTDASLFHVEDLEGVQPVLSDITEAGVTSGEDAPKYESMYVIILIEILDAVIPNEAYLFSQEELDFFCQFDKLSYQAKYLLLRLSLRKEGKWHSLSGLDSSYHADLGPLLPGAMAELSGKQTTAPEEPQPRTRKKAANEVIDLTLDDDDQPSPAANPSRHVPATSVASCSRAATCTAPDQDRPAPPLFAQGERSADLSDLLQCLNKDQLKQIANQLKLDKVNKKSREELIASLLVYATSQSTLTHERGPLRQLTLNFHLGKKTSQSDMLRSRIMKILGHAIKLEPHVLVFLRRLQIVFFRATKYAADLFLPSILAKAKRRNYAKYEYKRTDTVFPSRDRFLSYVKALMIESEIDDLLEGFGFMYQPKSKAAKAHAESISTTPRQDAAQRAKELAAAAWKEWDELVTAAEESGVEDEPFLARFHPGHVYTRILHSSCKALAILKDYKSEITALKYLLGQSVWRNSKRGAWYERLAVIYTQYAKDRAILDEEDSQKFSDEDQPHLHLAREIVLRGLEDPDTHLVWRITLENRIFKLENRLKIPKEDRYKAARRLKNPPKVVFQGERVMPRADSPAKGTLPFAAQAASVVEEEPWKGKSIWIGENGEHISVEELAIQWYAGKGFKAVHSEGRVVTSIFALTFWDILFSPVPGAFETKFQNAPLDMFHDTFFQSRRAAIEERLAELEEGNGREILEAVDDRERPRQTVCIGMRWDKFSKEDLGDIVDCLGGKALSIICRILCQDYSGRCSGVPDLLAWDPSRKKAKFIEVKGPGDTLRENQRLWIHCLLSAGVDVELCHVEERGSEAARSRSKSRSKSRRVQADDETTAEESDAESESDGGYEPSQESPCRKRPRKASTKNPVRKRSRPSPSPEL